MAVVLEASNVEKVYGGGRQAATRALDGISLTVNQGESVAIMGPSGSGKTTLLNCIATIDRPTAGTIAIDGIDVTTMGPAALARFRRESLGFIFQHSNLLDTLTIRENIALPLTISRVRPKEIVDRVESMASRLGVGDCLDKYPYQVSGGQAQRSAACRALVCDPSLVLADEPTGALDSKNARLLLESFERLNRERNATILMVTHDAFAASYCHRVLFIRDGRIFTELVRGELPHKEFFDRIMGVVTVIGGEPADAR